MSDPDDIIQDCRQGERDKAFRDWLVEKGGKWVAQFWADNATIETAVDAIIEFCDTSELRAEFESQGPQEFPETAKGIPGEGK
jgi:hypothetical protein